MANMRKPKVGDHIILGKDCYGDRPGKIVKIVDIQGKEVIRYWYVYNNKPECVSYSFQLLQNPFELWED